MLVHPRGAYQSFPLAPRDEQMSIAALEGGSDFSADDDSAESDPENDGHAFPGRQQDRARVEPPPCPEPSRLDDWYLGVVRAGSQQPTPVTFFPEVHEELTGMWMAPFTARNRLGGSSSLTTLDGGAAKGYTRIPPVERAAAMQLCPNSTWCEEPCLPSQACRFSSDLFSTRLTKPVGKLPLPCTP